MWQPARPACNARSRWHHMVHESVGGEQTRGASCTCTASQKHRAPTCAPNDAYLLPRLYPEGDALEDGVQVRPVSHLQTRMCVVTVQALMLHGLGEIPFLWVCHDLHHPVLHLQGHLWRSWKSVQASVLPGPAH